ncbi:MAG: Hsp20/alpha crystallin family protein [Anaerolineales bacterium]|nr:Hsp20/alpha crystallin family protein [Anaerolineales bacterium]
MATQIWKSIASPERTYVTLQAIGWQVNLRSYSWSPPTDVYETETCFVVRVEVAGMRQSEFSINVEGNYLVISGARTDLSERRAYHQMEIRFGEFSTAIELPSGVNVDRADAEYEDGFLSVVLPKIKPAEIKIIN